MKQNVSTDMLLKRFHEIKELNSKITGQPIDKFKKPVTISNSPKKEQSYIAMRKENNTINKNKPKQQLILSKGDIVNAVVKIKPYLVEPEQRHIKDSGDFTKQQQDLMSELLIIQNNRLCSKLAEQYKPVPIKSEKSKPGCVFEVVFYEDELREKKPDEPQIIVDLKRLQNAYAVVTENLQIFYSLADSTPGVTLQMAFIEFVQYYNDISYDYIRIRHTNQVTHKKCWINIGFISRKQFNLFDRMLFLAKQIARTSPGRLFDNKLLYEMLEKY